jgi:hypothetical protein
MKATRAGQGAQAHKGKSQRIQEPLSSVHAHFSLIEMGGLDVLC